MYINSIELLNYRPYRGEVTINFGYDSQKNFNVILGNNASGKSSLLNAFTWGFFGEELHDMREKKNQKYNKLTARDCLIGDTFKVGVKINLFEEDEQNNKNLFVIERSLTFEKDIAEIKEVENRLVVVDTDGESYSGNQAQAKINMKIPEKLHDYFFFNGETLAGYFEPTKSINLRKNVEEIAQVDLIDIVKKHLTEVRHSYNADFKQKNKSTQPLVNQIESLEEEISLKNTEKENIKEEIDSFTDSIQICNDKISKLNLKDIDDLIEEREELTNKRDILSKKIDLEKKRYNKLVVKLYPIVKLFDVIFDAATIKDYNIDSEEVPKKYLELVYNKILNDEKCICGVNFNEYPEHRQNIEILLTKIKTDLDSESGDTITTDLKNIKLLFSDFEYNFNQLKSLRKSLYENNKTLDTIISDLSAILNDIATSDSDEAEYWAGELESSEEGLEEAKDKLDRINEKIGILKNKKGNLDKELEDLTKDNEEASLIFNKKSFCEEGISVLELIDDNLKDKICEKVSNYTNQQFVGTNWSDGKFKKVEIDENYNVNILDALGEINAPGDLSGGEEIILALSFITALHNISGFDLPLFIDAPLSKLDYDYGNSFIKDLHDFCSHKQIIFLFTDRQYDEDVQNSVSPHLNKEYNLNKINSFSTEVIEVVKDE